MSEHHPVGFLFLMGTLFFFCSDEKGRDLEEGGEVKGEELQTEEEKDGEAESLEGEEEGAEQSLAASGEEESQPS